MSPKLPGESAEYRTAVRAVRARQGHARDLQSCAANDYNRDYLAESDDAAQRDWYPALSYPTA